MRTLVLVVIGCGVLFSTLPSQTIHAQDGGIARLSSAAYAPNSPVVENKLFRYQTGHYGFAYNCDREECKRNNPAICWRKADQPQLPKPMGLLNRVRHEAAQVSRRILDGMCNEGCETCQQQPAQTAPPCGCASCLAGQNSFDSTTEIASVEDVTTNQTERSRGLLSVKQTQTQVDHPPVEAAPTTLAAAKKSSASRRRSGLISLKPLEPATGVELGPGEILVGEVEVVPAMIAAVQPPIESVAPPVARITSATVNPVAEPVLNPVAEILRQHSEGKVAEALPPSPEASTQRMSLVERLRKAQPARVSEVPTPKKF